MRHGRERMSPAPKSRPYYEAVRDEIRANIESGRMEDGLTFYGAALADRLGVSRPPVKRALELLAAEGLVRRAGRRGYVVGGASAQPRDPTNLYSLDLDLSRHTGPDLSRPSWERIVERVGDRILAAIPFGMFQVSEALIGDAFAVSRTVVRDVLSRLQGRGLVGKDRRSHWVAGPLGAQAMDEMHAMRRLLEPAALAGALPHLDRGELLAARARLADVSDPPALERAEDDLHRRPLRPLRNRRLAEAVGQIQVSLVVHRLFTDTVGLHEMEAVLAEHRLVYDHLLIGDADGTRGALQFHLDADHARARARLKVLSLFDAPGLAPYLIRIH